jgi:hypothetical protein
VTFGSAPRGGRLAAEVVAVPILNVRLAAVSSDVRNGVGGELQRPAVQRRRDGGQRSLPVVGSSRHADEVTASPAEPGNRQATATRHVYPTWTQRRQVLSPVKLYASVPSSRSQIDVSRSIGPLSQAQVQAG